MKIWSWQKNGLTQHKAFSFSAAKPVVIICGGSFNVDNPQENLTDEKPVVTDFFNFILRYINAEPEVFRKLICGSLEGKLKLNGFTMLKLLGLVCARPGHPLYPATLAPSHHEEVNIFEVSYTHTHQCIESIYNTYKDIGYISADARHFVKLLFEPVLERCGSNEGRICRQLSLITLFGISYGSNFIIEVENALVLLLAEYGFSAVAQQNILNSVFAIAVSNIASVTRAEGPRFRAIYFEGSNDKLAEWINPYKTKGNEQAELKIISMTPYRLLLLSPVTVTALRWIEILPEFDYFWLDNDTAAHYTPFYTMRCLPENLLPELVERVLRNAIKRFRIIPAATKDYLISAPPMRPCCDTDVSEKVKADALIGFSVQPMTSQ